MLVCGVQDSQSSLLVQVGPGETLYTIDPITWWFWRSSCPKREYTSETCVMEPESAEMPGSDAGVHIAWDPGVVRGEDTEEPQAKHLLPLGSPLLCLEEGKLFGRRRASCFVSRLDHERCLESYRVEKEGTKLALLRANLCSKMAYLNSFQQGAFTEIQAAVPWMLKGPEESPGSPIWSWSYKQMPSVLRRCWELSSGLLQEQKALLPLSRLSF